MLRRDFIAATAAMFSTGCAGPGSQSFNFRFKLVVRENDKLHEGSSVIRTTWNDQRNSIASASSGLSFSVTTVGEAPFVSIGNRGLLFGLLTKLFYGSNPDEIGQDRRYPGRMLVKTLSERWPGTWLAAERDLEKVPDILRRVSAVNDEVDLVRDDYPTLVRFRDTNDPTSVELVDPLNLPAQFGSDVSLQRCSVQLVQENVTRTIDKTLPWLATLRNSGINNRLGPAMGKRGDPQYFPHLLTDEFFARSGS